MAGSRLPVAVAHGEGRAEFAAESSAEQANVALAYVDNHGNLTRRYPYNPNGSEYGVAGLSNDDGRFHNHDAASGTRVPNSDQFLDPTRMG